jgi:hypothetical protein
MTSQAVRRHSVAGSKRAYLGVGGHAVNDGINDGGLEGREAGVEGRGLQVRPAVHAPASCHDGQPRRTARIRRVRLLGSFQGCGGGSGPQAVRPPALHLPRRICISPNRGIKAINPISRPCSKTPALHLLRRVCIPPGEKTLESKPEPYFETLRQNPGLCANSCGHPAILL